MSFLVAKVYGSEPARSRNQKLTILRDSTRKVRISGLVFLCSVPTKRYTYLLFSTMLTVAGMDPLIAKSGRYYQNLRTTPLYQPYREDKLQLIHQSKIWAGIYGSQKIANEGARSRVLHSKIYNRDTLLLAYVVRLQQDTLWLVATDYRL